MISEILKFFRLGMSFWNFRFLKIWKKKNEKKTGKKSKNQYFGFFFRKIWNLLLKPIKTKTMGRNTSLSEKNMWKYCLEKKLEPSTFWKRVYFLGSTLIRLYSRMSLSARSGRCLMFGKMAVTATQNRLETQKSR